MNFVNSNCSAIGWVFIYNVKDHFVLYTAIHKNITKIMKTVTKQGPIKINQTGIFIVLQKQWHRLASIIKDFRFLSFKNRQNHFLYDLKIIFLRHHRHNIILTWRLDWLLTWIHLWETLLILVFKLVMYYII